MSPPIRKKYRDSVAFATGCRKIKNFKWKRCSSPTKPTTPCSSLLVLAGESLRMNVGLDRGIKTSSTGRERIGKSVTEMKAGVRQSVGELAGRSRKGYSKGRRVRARRLSLRIGWSDKESNLFL
ncbi:hypothetical protein Tco_0871817 [Tanacetum coccineum]